MPTVPAVPNQATNKKASCSFSMLFLMFMPKMPTTTEKHVSDSVAVVRMSSSLMSWFLWESSSISIKSSKSSMYSFRPFRDRCVESTWVKYVSSKSSSSCKSLSSS